MDCTWLNWWKVDFIVFECFIKSIIFAEFKDIVLLCHKIYTIMKHFIRIINVFLLVWNAIGSLTKAYDWAPSMLNFQNMLRPQIVKLLQLLQYKKWEIWYVQLYWSPTKDSFAPLVCKHHVSKCYTGLQASSLAQIQIQKKRMSAPFQHSSQWDLIVEIIQILT